MPRRLTAGPPRWRGGHIAAPQCGDVAAGLLGGLLARCVGAIARAWQRADRDGDGSFDDDETAVYGTNPDNPDTDGDGLNDEEEVTYTFTSPLSPDTDGDGVGDLTEYRNGTLPCSAESCVP